MLAGGEKVKDSGGKDNKKVEKVSTTGIQYGLRMVRDLQICLVPRRFASEGSAKVSMEVCPK